MSGDLTIISYSHQDEVWKNLLERHLTVLAKQGITEIWTDRRIGAGDVWEKKIHEAINSARVAILLVSADFLGSEFILKVEATQILKRQQTGELDVVPVLVRPCAWQAVPWLREIQLRPWKGKPLSSLPRNRQEAEAAEIAKEVLGILRPDLHAPLSVARSGHGEQAGRAT